jgi:hypothetical protein
MAVLASVFLTSSDPMGDLQLDVAGNSRENKETLGKNPSKVKLL